MTFGRLERMGLLGCLRAVGYPTRGIPKSTGEEKVIGVHRRAICQKRIELINEQRAQVSAVKRTADLLGSPLVDVQCWSMCLRETLMS